MELDHPTGCIPRTSNRSLSRNAPSGASSQGVACGLTMADTIKEGAYEMATKTTTKKSKTEEAVSKTASRLAEMFLDRISEVDENGKRQIIKDPKILGDWAKPWTRRGSQAPHNPFTGSGYRGGNAALLMFAAFEQDHACYGTFNNWRDLTTEVKNKDGEVIKAGVVVSVKKGESAWQGVYWKQSYVCAQGFRGFKKTRS